MSGSSLNPTYEDRRTEKRSASRLTGSPTPLTLIVAWAIALSSISSFLRLAQPATWPLIT